MRFVRALAACAFLGAFVGSAGAQVPVGGYTSENIEWLGNLLFPEQGHDSPAAVHHQNYLYVAAESAVPLLIVYDTSDPEAPREVGRLLIPGIQNFRGTPSTNGRILVIASAVPQEGIGLGDESLLVIDVADKTRPAVLSQTDARSHSYTCAIRCTWAYGSVGDIYELHDPEEPRLRGNWLRGIETHEIAGGTSANLREVRRGLLLTRSVPMYLLDARRDPTRPRVWAKSDGRPYSGGWVDWPDAGRANVILTHNGFHTESPSCDVRLEGTGLDSGFQTWDATGWRQSGLFLGIDTFKAGNGTYSDGDPAVSPPHGCVPSRFDSHPEFRNTRLVALSYHAHGVKLLEVDQAGAIEQVGFFLPYEHANFDEAYWVDETTVWAISNRGIDVLRVDTKPPVDEG